MRKSPTKLPSQDDVQAAFGTTVRGYRTSQGLTQEELAAAAELHVTYVSQVERGLRNVSLHNIHRLAFALGITPAMLLEGMSS
jgi:transcriptional regulator with XRE-family HTH domain